MRSFAEIKPFRRIFEYTISPLQQVFHLSDFLHLQHLWNCAFLGLDMPFCFLVSVISYSWVIPLWFKRYSNLGISKSIWAKRVDFVCLIWFYTSLAVKKFQLWPDGSSWVEPVLSKDQCVLPKDAMQECFWWGLNPQALVLQSSSLHHWATAFPLEVNIWQMSREPD